jgi:hypothetical protein
VVGQLAARYAIQVHLRASAYGGVTAVVLVPPELVAVGPDVPPPADDGTPATDLADEIEVMFDVSPVRPQLQAQPAGAPAPALPVRVPASPVDASTPGGGLPRRVRQASLAPQLREPAAPAAADDAAGDSEPTRSPEQMRSMLSAFQDGMTRGRRQQDPPDTGPAAP